MLLNKIFLPVVIFGSILLSACGDNKETNTPKHTVEEYVNDPSLTKQVISDCDSKVATLKDHEEIYASGDCHNAQLASKEISKKRNSASNKPTEVKIVH